jgi:ABC-type Mn2+/Zn2+ transport system permease subunit
MSPFSLPFMWTALASGLLAGTALSLIGVFLTARRASFAGLAVSQLAALGAVAGIACGLEHGLMGASFLLAWAGMLLLPRLARRRRASEESWTACLYVLGAGLSVAVLSKTPHGEARAMTVFFGNVLALGPSEIWESAAMLAAAALFLGLWYPRWIWMSFDPASAAVSGLKTGRWDAFFFSLFAALMAAGIHVLGVLLAFAHLVLPAALGFLAARRPAAVFGIAAGSSAAATAAGLYLSFRLDVPAGPFIASLLGTAVLVAGALRWRRPAH